MEIQLFGSPAILKGTQRFEHRSRKAMALLAYLAMRADEHISRQHLAALLWGDSAEEQARANLRQTLSQLRKLFRKAGHDPVMVPFDNVVLVSRGLRIDARDLLRGKAMPGPDCPGQVPAFLEGFTVAAPEFDSWVAAQRSRITAQLTRDIERAAEEALAQGLNDVAAERLAAALALDPLRESLHRNLIRALLAQNQTDRALAQYKRCREILARELDVEPDLETRRLAAEIRARRLACPSGDGTAEAFVRYPEPRPTLVIADAGAPGATARRFDDPETALWAALEAARRATDRGPSGAGTIAVVPDSGETAQDGAAAEALARGAEPGAILVHPAVYDQFRHWSPFAFEPAPAGPGGGAGYRLVSQMPRHRFQMLPANAAPAVEPMSEFSVAVLPLVDRSPQAGEFALGDELSEVLTHRLSRFRSLTVAAPSAGRAFRAQRLSVDRARSTLGVNYLVDGSVLRAGERLRIGISLIDLRTGSLVFNDHFDGAFESIFEHQDALIDRISSALFRNAEKAEVQRAERMPTNDIGAYEWYLRGLAAHRRAGISPQNARDAFGHFSRAIEIDPNFARAYAWRICAVGWYAPEYYEEPGLREIHFALSIDEHDAEVRRIAGALHLYRGDYEDGLRHIERAVELNPSDAYLLASSAVYWAYSGDPEYGLKHIERAMVLDPFLPVWCVEDHGVVLYSMAEYGRAIESLKRLPFPTPRALSFLAASQVAKSDLDGARASVAKIRHIVADFTVDQLMTTLYYRRTADKQTLCRRLNEAGLG